MKSNEKDSVIFYVLVDFLGTFDDELQLCFNWACALDMVIDHDKKEIHINGFSENDMY